MAVTAVAGCLLLSLSVTALANTGSGYADYKGYKLFIGAAVPMANILNVFALLVAYTLIFFAISSWTFEKKEY